jgi:ribosomal protein S21
MEGLNNEELKIPKATRAPLRLKPQIGRTINLAAGIDILHGVRLLEQVCARNKIRSDFNKQRFHERPGLKRKRLKSERWRKNFRASFQAVVNRVKQLKVQGW